MQKLKINGWKFHIDGDSSIAGNIVRRIENSEVNGNFRKKNNRAIFKMEHNGCSYFIKYNYPLNLFHGIIDYFIPKSISEFKSGELLRKAGIPGIEMLGYGVNGARSILITRDIGVEYSNAIEFWRKFESDPQIRRKFIDGLGGVIRKFTEAGLAHPDFHLGNLMARYKDEALSFVFVDPYGIRRCHSKNAFKNGAGFMISTFFDRLTLKERVFFLISSGVIASESEYKPARNRIISSIDDKWGKRRKKILKGKSRYTSITKAGGRPCHVRTDPYTRKPLIDNNLLDTGDFKGYEVVELDRAEARARWLFSLYLDCRNMPHVRPLAWLQNENGQDMLVYEKMEVSPDMPDEEDLNEFMDICHLNRLKNISRNDVIFSGGKLYLRNSVSSLRGSNGSDNI